VYPLFVVAEYFQLPGATFGVVSGLLGLYLLFRGLGVERAVDGLVDRARSGLYAGRVTLVTYIVAAALLVIGGAGGIEEVATVRESVGEAGVLRGGVALVNGAIVWFAAAGIVASLGRITDEYLHERFKWRYCNAPFYVLAIAAVLEGVTAYFLQYNDATYLAGALTVGTLLGVVSTLVFAIAEARLSPRVEPTA